MDAAYLHSSVGPLLAEGLAATLLRNPPDKVEFLAHWLRNSVEEKAGLAAREAAQAAQAAADAEAESAAAVAAEQSARAAASRESTDAEREKQFEHLLATASNADALMPAFLQFLRTLTGASSAYIGRLQGPDANASDDAPDAGLRSLKYVAATPDNEWLLDKRLDEKKGKVTFELFGEEPEQDEEEEAEEEEDENGNPIPRAKKEKEPRSVFVPNVLLGAKSAHMHFWKLPKLGSYLAVKLSFPTAVADETLDEACEREGELLALKKEQDEEKARAKKEAEDEARREAGLDVEEDEERSGSDEDEDEEDEDDSASARRSRRANKKESKEDEGDAGGDGGAESESEEDRDAREKAEEEARLVEEEEFILSQLTRPQTEYALCLDTLGQNRRFSDAQLAVAMKYAKALQAKLAALDRALFSAERKRRLALVEFHRELAEMNEGGSLRSEEEKAEELERLSDELEAQGKPMTDEDVLYKYRSDLILSQLKPQIAEFPEMEVFPRGNLAVLQAVLFLLGYDKNKVVDLDGRPDWKRMRVLFTDDFFARLRDYDPRLSSHDSVAPERRYTESVAVGKIVADVVYEEVKEKNYVLSELLLWVREALAVKRRAKVERAKQARDEARKKAAAEAAAAEEAAAKAAEEEEAARIAAGGEPNEGDEEEEEEEEEED